MGKQSVFLSSASCSGELLEPELGRGVLRTLELWYVRQKCGWRLIGGQRCWHEALQLVGPDSSSR